MWPNHRICISGVKKSIHLLGEEICFHGACEGRRDRVKLKEIAQFDPRTLCSRVKHNVYPFQQTTPLLMKMSKSTAVWRSPWRFHTHIQDSSPWGKQENAHSWYCSSQLWSLWCKSDGRAGYYPLINLSLHILSAWVEERGACPFHHHLLSLRRQSGETAGYVPW